MGCQVSEGRLASNCNECQRHFKFWRVSNQSCSPSNHHNSPYSW